MYNIFFLVQKIKSKVANDWLPTICQETTESVTINDKTKPQTSTETPPSSTNIAAPTPPQEKVKQKNQHQKRSSSRRITSREAALRKYKKDLKFYVW